MVQTALWDGPRWRRVPRPLWVARGPRRGSQGRVCGGGSMCPPRPRQCRDWMSYRCWAPSDYPQMPGCDEWGQLTAELSQAGLHLELWDIWSVISCFSAGTTHPPISFCLAHTAWRVTAERSCSVITDINTDVADLSSSWLQSKSHAALCSPKDLFFSKK